MRMKQTKRLIFAALTMVLIFMMSFAVDAAALTVTKRQVNYPTSFKSGATFTMKGSLQSNKLMKKVTTAIYNSTGKKCLQKYAAAPNAVTYNLANSDSKLHFESLKPGTYYYRISVVDVNNTSLRVLNKQFKVTKAAKMVITKKQVAVPGTLKQGKDFNMSGTVTATKPMKSIVFTIYKGSKCLQRYTATVNGTSYDIANANSYLKFDKLAAGEYYYRISIYDMNSKKTRITNKKFTVAATTTQPTTPTTTSSIKISNPKPATSITMREGTSYGIEGNITSTKTLGSVKAEIIDAKKASVFTATVQPNATSYNLAGSALDTKMKFNELKPGMYTFVVSATDSEGKKAVLINRSIFVIGKNSSFKIENPAPSKDTTISKGQSYAISGAITSKLNITSITGTLLNAGGTAVYKITDTPASKTYLLGDSKIDRGIKFNTLAAGTYYLNILVTDSDGSIAPVISKKMVIK